MNSYASWPAEQPSPTTLSAVLRQIIATAEAELDRLARLSTTASPPPEPEREPRHPPPPPDFDATKRCPDCSEMVKEPAKVCRFCGHRFDGGKLGTALRVVDALTAGPDFVPVGKDSTRLPPGGGSDRHQRKKAKALLKSYRCYADDRFQRAIVSSYPDLEFCLGAKAMLRNEKGIGNLLAHGDGLVFLRHESGVLGGSAMRAHEFPFADIEWTKADPQIRAGALRVAVPGHIWEFFDIRPRNRADAFERFARSRGVD